MKVSRSGDDTADRHNNNVNNKVMQELAAAGPSAIESFGPEPGGEVVYVEITDPYGIPRLFKLRCGLVAEGRPR